MKKTKLIASLAIAMSVMAAIPAMANWNHGQGENSARWCSGGRRIHRVPSGRSTHSIRSYSIGNR